MNDALDTNFRQWLSGFVQSWGMPIDQVALTLQVDEIANRFNTFPAIAKAISSTPVDLSGLKEAAKESWVLQHRIHATRFNVFMKDKDAATTAILQLISNFPDDNPRTIERINDCLDDYFLPRYEYEPGKFDRSGAAQLISVILTSQFPKRFVDFRQNRWNLLARYLKYQDPPGATYGEKLVWAGMFAQAISQTPTYQMYWDDREPLWVIAGICWHSEYIGKPAAEPFDLDVMSFPEGSAKRRLHLARERNASLIAQAKSLALASNPLLRCEVCGFSFREKYGDLGEGYIEAHHKVPVSQLKSGSRTLVKDIALVCPNCHRMLHRGEHSLSIEELQAIVQSEQKKKANEVIYSVLH